MFADLIERSIRLTLVSCFLIGTVALMPLAAQKTAAAASDPGEEAFQARDWPEVVDDYKKITGESPDDGGAWYRLGRGQEELGRFNEALAAFQKASALGFQKPLTSIRIAACFAALSEPEHALTVLEELASSGFPLKQVIDAEPRFAALQLDPRYKKIMDRIDINGSPCRNPQTPEYRQFDFWIGDWDVFDSNGNKVATDNVQLILKSCVLAEDWKDEIGAEGRSLSRYNAPMKQWEQYWVDEGPTRLFFTGHFGGGAMKMQTEGFTDKGVAVTRRLTYSKLSDDSVRQLAEVSKDGGKSFTTEYELTFKRQKKEEPTGVSSSAPQPSSLH